MENINKYLNITLYNVGQVIEELGVIIYSYNEEEIEQMYLLEDMVKPNIQKMFIVEDMEKMGINITREYLRRYGFNNLECNWLHQNGWIK